MKTKYQILEELYQSKKLEPYIKKNVPPDEVDEFIQAVFSILLNEKSEEEIIKSYKENKGSIFPLAYGIAKNKICDFYKSKSRRGVEIEYVDDECVDDLPEYNNGAYEGTYDYMGFLCTEYEKMIRFNMGDNPITKSILKELNKEYLRAYLKGDHEITDLVERAEARIAINSLNDDIDRQIVQLRGKGKKGVPYIEISSIVGVSVRAARARHSRAIDEIQEIATKNINEWIKGDRVSALLPDV